MPTYVYECAKCGDEFEIWQSIKDDPLKRHTGSCRGKLTKVIQPVGIVLKGSGFYKNDSNGSKRGKGSGSTDTTAGESTATDSGTASSSTPDSSSGSSDSSSGSSDSSSGSSGSSDSSSGSGNGSSSTKKAAKTSSS